VPLNINDTKTGIKFTGKTTLKIIKSLVFGTCSLETLIYPRYLVTAEFINKFENIVCQLQDTIALYSNTNTTYTYTLDIGRGTNILKLSTNILQNLYMQSKFLNVFGPRLDTPLNLHINITQSTKITDIINNILKINPFLKYTISNPNSNSYITIPFNKTFPLPPDGLNVYITADLHKYPLQVTEAHLNVEYI
jgi:hypothetical protein